MQNNQSKGVVTVDNERLGKLEVEVKNLDGRVSDISENMKLVSRAIVSIDKTLVSVNEHIAQNNVIVKDIKPKVDDLMINRVKVDDFKSMAAKVNNNDKKIYAAVAIISAIGFYLKYFS